MSRFGLTRRQGLRGLWILLIPVVFFGCNKSTSGGGTKALRVFVHETWSELEVNSLAYVGLGSTMVDAAAEKIANRIIEGELRGGQDRFILLRTDTIETRAKKAGKSSLLEKVQKVWRNDRKVDQFLAVELSEALGVDGLLLADLSDWTEDRIDYKQEGTSWTRVGLGLFIYGGESGLLVWGADRNLRVDSIFYGPGQVEQDLAESERNQRSLNQNDTTPEPPPIKEVAREVLGELIGSFPPR